MAKILVVDDEHALRDMMTMRLKANGYDVVTAIDGEDGLNKARAERPDLILLDIMMPAMDGLMVLSRLKSDLELSFVPVIMLTAKSDTEAIMESQSAGAADYILKPFDGDELMKLVKKTLELNPPV